MASTITLSIAITRWWWEGYHYRLGWVVRGERTGWLRTAYNSESPLVRSAGIHHMNHQGPSVPLSVHVYHRHYPCRDRP